MKRLKVVGIFVAASSAVLVCCAAVVLVPNEGLYPRPTELAPPQSLPSGPWWEEALKLLDGPIKTLTQGARNDTTFGIRLSSYFTSCGGKAARIKQYKETIEDLVERAITSLLQQMNYYLDEIIAVSEGPHERSDAEETQVRLKELLDRVDSLQQELKANLTPPAGRT